MPKVRDAIRAEQPSLANRATTCPRYLGQYSEKELSPSVI